MHIFCFPYSSPLSTIGFDKCISYTVFAFTVSRYNLPNILTLERFPRTLVYFRPPFSMKRIRFSMPACEHWKAEINFSLKFRKPTWSLTIERKQSLGRNHVVLSRWITSTIWKYGKNRVTDTHNIWYLHDYTSILTFPSFHPIFILTGFRWKTLNRPSELMCGMYLYITSPSLTSVLTNWEGNVVRA